MKATKKPVEIEFFTFDEIVEFGKQANPDSIHGNRAWNFEFKGHNLTHENDECYIIPTLEGNHNFTPNDVLIVGVKGEIYPCKKDIFDRLRKEFKELKDKAWKLHDFISSLSHSELVVKVGADQADLLKAQLNAMNVYLYILGFRLTNLNIDVDNL